MSLPILTSLQLRTLEARYANLPLMERAGQAATDVALGLLGKARLPVLIFDGPGNNGGDARVVARLLMQRGVEAVVCGIGEEPPVRHYGLVVDGLFGIGLTRPVVGDAARLVERINAFNGPVLALDIPSGLNGDTGQVMGVAVCATHTATFIAAKPGLYMIDGPDLCGAISVHDLGLSLDDADAAGRLLDRAQFAQYLAPRAAHSHKGSYGSLGVIGGAAGMTGAALLAARAGLHLGAGRTFVGLLAAMMVDPMQPELMLRTVDDAMANATALVVGPGLGDSPAALAALRLAVDAPQPLLLDADALNLIAAHPVLGAHLARRDVPALLTPHPAEAARLLGGETTQVQGDRIEAARMLAKKFKAHVALKGNGTVLAHADGHWCINTNGNPGLASGGTGDVLAGIGGALLAQGWPGWEALCAAVHLHGAAADLCVAGGIGPIGLTAGELIPRARTLLNRWSYAGADLMSARPSTGSGRTDICG